MCVINLEMETEISHRGYSIALKSLPPHFLNNIKSELYVKPIENPNFQSNETAYPIFRISKSKIYTPRYYGLQKYGTPVKNILRDGLPIDVEFQGTIRPIQQETIDKTFVNGEIVSGLISLDTGLGKTVVALKLVSLLRQKTLIIVHADFLLDQWISRIKQFLPTARVGVIKQERCEIEETDIVIGMIQTIIKREYPKETFHSFGNMIIDECFPFTQKIVTNNGLMKIGAVYNLWKSKKVLPLVLSFNEQLQTFEYKKITYAWEKTNEKLLKISYSKSDIKCTENHRILTLDGYKQANELVIGDLIKCNINENLQESMVARTLNSDQYQVFLGSYLGDGNVDVLPSQRYRLRIIHGEKQEEYCRWKAFMFDSNVNKIENNGYAKTTAYKFCTKLIDLPKEKQITKNYKTCPQWILDDLDYRGLAIWWMDDGSLSKSSFYGSLSTCSFDEETHIRFIEKFKKMDIECSYRPDGHGYLSIYFNKKGIYSLLSKIREYLHESLRYKFFNKSLEESLNEYYYGNEQTVYTCISNINPNIIKENAIINVNQHYYYIKNCKKCNCLRFHFNDHSYLKCCICRGSKITHYIQIEPPKEIDHIYLWNNEFLNYGTVKITKIETIINTSTNSHVYDIEVEDNHNFICSNSKGGIGPIVHNCHHICSRTFSTLFYKVQPKYLLGLSATPERKDGLSKVLYWFLGPQIVNIKRETDKPVISFIFNNTEGYQEKFNRLGKVNIPEMITDLSLKSERNKLIVDLASNLIKESRKILILSERRDQCEYFCNRLKEKEISTGLYLGGMKTLDRENSVVCKIIVGTYQAAGEGFDVADLDTLILATPKSDVEQAVGRILRQRNANEPLVIDIVDSFSIFKGQYYKRRKFYKSRQFLIKN